MSFNPNMILPAGTQIVARVEVRIVGGGSFHPAGAVGVIVRAPADHTHNYLVQFPDGSEAAIRRTEFVVLKAWQRDRMDGAAGVLEDFDLMHCVVYRCIVGSRAYGLDTESSDIDRRGIYLPPARMHWSLFSVPEQLDSPETEECYWEFQKFLTLCLKANPNALECLYTPLVEEARPVVGELLEAKSIFVSRLVYQTYNGYVLSQFKKIEARLRNHGGIKWKHAMHLIRLLIAGITALREGYVPVAVGEERERLLEIRDGALSWDEVDAWRLQLHREFESAFSETRLPERPDYERANSILVAARRSMVNE